MAIYYEGISFEKDFAQKLANQIELHFKLHFDQIEKVEWVIKQSQQCFELELRVQSNFLSLYSKARGENLFSTMRRIADNMEKKASKFWKLNDLNKEKERRIRESHLARVA